MAAIDELIQQIQNPVLRERIRTEVEGLSKQKKFGLVFEEHLPECTPLYDMPIEAAWAYLMLSTWLGKLIKK